MELVDLCSSAVAVCAMRQADEPAPPPAAHIRQSIATTPQRADKKTSHTETRIGNPSAHHPAPAACSDALPPMRSGRQWAARGPLAEKLAVSDSKEKQTSAYPDRWSKVQMHGHDISVRCCCTSEGRLSFFSLASSIFSLVSSAVAAHPSPTISDLLPTPTARCIAHSRLNVPTSAPTPEPRQTTTPARLHPTESWLLQVGL